MFSITNHALRRYVERILGLKLNKEDYDEMMKDMGVSIVETITDMIRNSDLIFSQNSSRYFVYRNIAIIIKDDCVVTMYEIHNEFDKLSDYITHIKDTQKSIKQLTTRHQQARFENDVPEMRALNLRLDQYEDWFFNNKLSDSK